MADKHYINTTDRDTGPGNCVYEVHYHHEVEGGWSIRFVEAPDSPEGVVEAQDHALEDIFRHYSEDLLRDITPPRMTSCVRFESWKWLRDHRAIRTPQDEAVYTYRDRKRKIRGHKRNSRLEDALEFLDDTDLFY